MENVKDEYLIQDGYTGDKDEEEDIDAINSIDDIDVSLEELAAEEKLSRGEACDGATLTPNYLRLSQAERPPADREQPKLCPDRCDRLRA